MLSRRMSPVCAPATLIACLFILCADLFFPASHAEPARDIASPTVLKVEPPNWCAGHSINPVRVMIRGRNLSNARVEAAGNGISVGRVRTNASGTYVFVDVTIDAKATAGVRSLKLTTTEGTTDARFEI